MSRAALDHLPAIQATPTFPREVPWALADAKMRLGPIFRIDGLSERPVVCMVGAEAGRFISHTHKDCFSHELGWTPIVDTFLGRSLFCMDGAEHTHYRKMLTPPFTNAAVERYMPIIMRVVRARTHDWADRGIVNVHEEIRRIVFGIAVETLIGGCSEADIDRLTRAFRTVTEGAMALDRDAGSAHMPEKMRAYDELTDILRNVVRKRRAIDSDLPGDPTDLMHIVVNAQDHRGRRLTDDQVLRHLRNVLAAAHVTSTTTCTSLLFLLSIHTAYLDRLRVEVESALGHEPTEVSLSAIRSLHQLGYAVDEAMRLRGPTGNLPRGVVRPFEYGGFQVPAGVLVLWSAGGGHRLPDVFSDPGAFDPDRFAPDRDEARRRPGAFSPFGAGPHVCLGMNLAQVELRAIVAHIILTYDLEPLDDRPLVLDYSMPDGFIPHDVFMRVRRRTR